MKEGANYIFKKMRKDAGTDASFSSAVNVRNIEISSLRENSKFKDLIV
jgi:hypothetical protein